jgi:hypothetical protein
MKKTLVIAGILCALALTGCRTKFDTRALDALTSLSQITPAEIGVTQMAVADSISLNGKSASVEILADFPESGNFFVINNIREWMSEQLGGTYAGNTENGQQLLDHYRKSILNNMREDILPDLPPIEDMACYENWTFAKFHETDKFVTYTCSREGYAGGAHGWFIHEGQTFRKSDGRRIDYDIFRTESRDELAELVKDNIFTQYFESNKEEFTNGLLLENPDFFPLPETAPLFTRDGVAFIYQQYEIAPYALGLPTCVISYDLIEPFLTQAGRELVNVSRVAEN